MLQWLHDKQQQQKLKAQGPWSFNWVFPFLDPYAVQNSTLFVPWNVFIHEVTMCSGYAFLLAWCLLHHNCPTLKQDKGSGSGIFNRKLVYMFKLVKNNCNCYNCHQQQQHLYYLLIFFLRGKFYLCNSFIYSSFIESGSGFSIGKYGCLGKIIKNEVAVKKKEKGKSLKNGDWPDPDTQNLMECVSRPESGPGSRTLR